MDYDCDHLCLATHVLLASVVGHMQGVHDNPAGTPMCGGILCVWDPYVWGNIMCGATLLGPLCVGEHYVWDNPAGTPMCGAALLGPLCVGEHYVWDNPAGTPMCGGALCVGQPCWDPYVWDNIMCKLASL